MSTTHDDVSNDEIRALLDQIQERVLRAIPDAKGVEVYLMDEAQSRGLSPLECLDYIEEHRLSDSPS